MSRGQLGFVHALRVVIQGDANPQPVAEPVIQIQQFRL
jgi:hypothetical protein